MFSFTVDCRKCPFNFYDKPDSKIRISSDIFKGLLNKFRLPSANNNQYVCNMPFRYHSGLKVPSQNGTFLEYSTDVVLGILTARNTLKMRSEKPIIIKKLGNAN